MTLRANAVIKTSNYFGVLAVLRIASITRPHNTVLVAELKSFYAVARCGTVTKAAAQLGVSQPTLSEHMRVLTTAGLVRAKRIKQWTFYKRDEPEIRRVKNLLRML